MHNLLIVEFNILVSEFVFKKFYLLIYMKDKIDINRFLEKGNMVTSNKSEIRNSKITDRRIDYLKKIDNKKYLESEKLISVLTECDILVCGGGPAGMCAAVAAKRCHPDFDVLLIEQAEFLGGTITKTGMESISWYQYGNATKTPGLAQELEKLASEMNATSQFPYNEGKNLATEPFKYVADEFILRNKVRLLLNITCTDVITKLEDNKKVITGIITESISGRQVINAKRVIDCTGNADIVHLSGARYTVLPENQRMGVTQVFSVKNVNNEKFLKYTEEKRATYQDWSTSWKQETSGKEDSLRTPYLDEEFKKAEKDGIIAKDSSICGSWSTLTDEGELLNLNLVHIGDVDALNVEEMTQASLLGRKKTMEAIKAMQQIIPGCENIKLRDYSTSIGIRDTRKVLNKYNFTGHDILSNKKFNTSVGICPRFVDGYNVLLLPVEGECFEFPYEILQSIDVNNLLVAGRCVGGDHLTHAAMRNMVCCFITGESAGVIAALSLSKDLSTDMINIKDIQEQLKKQNILFKI